MKKNFVILLSIICLLFSSSLSVLATPSDAQSFNRNFGILLNWQNNNGSHLYPTSVEYILTNGTVTNGSSNDISASTGYVRLIWDYDIPFIIYVSGTPGGDSYSTGNATLNFNPTYNVVTPTNYNYAVRGNYYSVTSGTLIAPSGEQFQLVRRENTPQFYVSWIDKPNSGGSYGGTIHLTYTCTLYGVNNNNLTRLDGPMMIQAATHTYLNINTRASDTPSNNSSYATFNLKTFSEQEYYAQLNGYLAGVEQSIASSQAAQASSEHDDVVNGYDNTSGNAANNSLESGLASYESEEAQAHNDFNSKMDSYTNPDTSDYVSGISFISSAVVMWWNGLGMFKIILLVGFSFMIFNFISRYRGG